MQRNTARVLKDQKHSRKIEILEKALEIDRTAQVKVWKSEKWFCFEK